MRLRQWEQYLAYCETTGRTPIPRWRFDRALAQTLNEGRPEIRARILDGAGDGAERDHPGIAPGIPTRRRRPPLGWPGAITTAAHVAQTDRRNGRTATADRRTEPHGQMTHNEVTFFNEERSVSRNQRSASVTSVTTGTFTGTLPDGDHLSTEGA